MKEQPIDAQNGSDYPRGKGTTTVSPEVLLTIARLTTLNSPGVSRMSDLPGGVGRLFKRGIGDGVRIDIQDERVSVDLFVVLKPDLNIREVSRLIQRTVNRAISEMVGMNVDRINVHVEDIDYPLEPDTKGT